RTQNAERRMLNEESPFFFIPHSAFCILRSVFDLRHLLPAPRGEGPRRSSLRPWSPPAPAPALAAWAAVAEAGFAARARVIPTAAAAGSARSAIPRCRRGRQLLLGRRG